MEWHHKAPYRKKNKAKMPEKLALSDGEVIILGGSKKPRIEWGARAGRAENGLYSQIGHSR